MSQRIVSITVDEATVPEADVERYLDRGYEQIGIQTRTYLEKPPLYVLRRVTYERES